MIFDIFFRSHFEILQSVPGLFPGKAYSRREAATGEKGGLDVADMVGRRHVGHGQLAALIKEAENFLDVLLEPLQ